MDNKEQMVGLIHEIDRLKLNVIDYWNKVRLSIDAGRVDDAISILHAYFHAKQQVEKAESQLLGILGGQYADR